MVRASRLSSHMILYSIEILNRMEYVPKNVVFIIIGDVTKEAQRFCAEYSRFNIDVWDIDKFVQICEKYLEVVFVYSKGP